MPRGNVAPDAPTTRYVPAGTDTENRPSAPELVSATSVLPRHTLMRAWYGRSGHGLARRSTGHVGPIVAIPAIPVSPDGDGVDAASGVVVTLAAGTLVADADTDAGGVPVARALAPTVTDAKRAAEAVALGALGVGLCSLLGPHAATAVASTTPITTTAAFRSRDRIPAA